MSERHDPDRSAAVSLEPPEEESRAAGSGELPEGSPGNEAADNGDRRRSEKEEQEAAGATAESAGSETSSGEEPASDGESVTETDALEAATGAVDPLPGAPEAATESPVAGGPVQGPPAETAQEATADALDEASAKGTEEAPGDSAEASPAKRGPRARSRPELPPELVALGKARDEGRPVAGRVFGWNPGGFHVVLDGVPAFCPRSEMELEASQVTDPDSYLDQTFEFRVLRIQGKGRRIVLSRAAVLKEKHQAQAAQTLKRVKPGAVLEGTVSSLTDFGAFVDLGGVEGMVHVSEIGRQRIAKPEEALSVGQQVQVKVLDVKKGGRRISLSMKALEPDPWQEVKKRFHEGMVVTGRVERTGPPGAFIELAPGLVGLLPTAEMGLPRDALPARAFPPGKEVKVMVMSVDPRRRRIALAPEGAAVGGSRHDYIDYVKQQEREGFGSLADAFRKLKR
jgi:predicted RNA-binding protein with RPS1 domain